MISAALYFAAAGFAATGLWELALHLNEPAFPAQRSAAADLATAMAVGPLAFAYSVSKVLEHLNGRIHRLSSRTARRSKDGAASNETPEQESPGA